MDNSLPNTNNLNINSQISNETKSHQRKMFKPIPNGTLSSQQDSLNLAQIPSKQFSSTSAFQEYGLPGSLSASTLQHSSTIWAFSKADRFPKLKPKYEGETDVELPSSLSKKTTSFGFGNKIDLSEMYSKQAHDLPAPNHYKLNSTIVSDPNKGKSFGLPFHVYSRTYLPNMTTQIPEVAQNYPGPGEYKVNEDIGIKKKKTTIKSRIKWFFEEHKPQAPPANYYTPNRDLVEPSRFKNISLGIGERMNFTNLGVRAPGPGTYKLPSIFDKFNKDNGKKKNPRHLRTSTEVDTNEDGLNSEDYAKKHYQTHEIKVKQAILQNEENDDGNDKQSKEDEEYTENNVNKETMEINNTD